MWLPRVELAPEYRPSLDLSQARWVVSEMNLLLVAVAGFCVATSYCSAQEPKEQASRDAHGEVLCMAITDDGQTVASGTWDRITLWDVATGKELHTLKGHDREVRSVAFSPDAKLLASGGRDMTIKLWN